LLTFQLSRQMSKDLKLEAGEKESKVQRLQDEVECVHLAFPLRLRSLQLTNMSLYNHSLIIDQIYDSDYSHLRPEEDDLFSDEEGDGVGGGTAEGGQRPVEGRNGGEEVTGKIRTVSSRFGSLLLASWEQGPRFGDEWIWTETAELPC